MTHFLFAHNIVVKSLQRGMDKGSCRGGEEETTTWSTATKDTLEKTFQNQFERSNDRDAMIHNNPIIICTFGANVASFGRLNDHQHLYENHQ